MLKVINSILSKKYFSTNIKIFTGTIFFILLFIGFSAYSVESKFLKELRNFNLANLIIWSYWWPIIIVTAIFFGRIWCMICPIELITSLFSIVGMKRKQSSWIKTGWAITVFYILVLFIGINGFAIHRNPTFMAFYLLSILLVAVIVGVYYEKNTFCKYVCPVGFLLALYSKLSFFGLRVKSQDICKNCSDKSCIDKTHLYNFNKKCCNVNLYPAKIADNSDCILCCGCMKTCKTFNTSGITKRQNPQWQVTKFSFDNIAKTKLTLAEIAFTIIVSGFVIYEIFVEWKVSKAILMLAPTYFSNLFSIENNIIFGLLKSSILFIILPLLVWLIPYLFGNLSGTKIKLKDYFSNFAIVFLPIIAGAHLCKAILKTTSRLPYFQYVFKDLSGMENTKLFLDGNIELFKLNAFSVQTITILLTLITSVSIWLSIKILKRKKKYKTKKSYYLIPIIYGSIFLIDIILWRII
jgi:polyferredoxin